MDEKSGEDSDQQLENLNQRMKNDYTVLRRKELQHYKGLHKKLDGPMNEVYSISLIFF